MEAVVYFNRENFSVSQQNILIRAIAWGANQSEKVFGSWCNTTLAGTATQWFAYKAANSALTCFLNENEELTVRQLVDAQLVLERLKERLSNASNFRVGEIVRC